MDSVVAGVRTWWRHGVCVWGGVKRQRSGTPSWGERVCVCGTHRGGGGFGEYAGWRSERSERSPLLGVLVASLGGSAGPDWYPRQRGALAGRPLGVWSGCQQGGACVGVRMVGLMGRVSVRERAVWGRVERDRRV